jgi:hypothetical protein
MKSELGVLLLLASLSPYVQARSRILPDACGSDKVKFHISEQKDQPAPAAPETGKAEIVFVNTVEKQGVGVWRGVACLGCNNPTRIGVDGAWVGANKGESYFAIPVAPGEHHLCANQQGTNNVDMATFTAEPGKVYYYQVKFTAKRAEGNTIDKSFELKPLSEDEGKYRVKISKLSTAVPSK